MSNFEFQGLNCCSNYTISFHYVSPKQMMVIEFAVYYLRPFGLYSSLKESVDVHDYYKTIETHTSRNTVSPSEAIQQQLFVNSTSSNSSQR